MRDEKRPTKYPWEGNFEKSLRIAWRIHCVEMEGRKNGGLTREQREKIIRLRLRMQEIIDETNRLAAERIKKYGPYRPFG
ncbi:MAG: hypothetical protein FWF59_05315 [Turicibacter sp.]|nr:hypothetical protein [Turicibacter sp.]